jgi:hypothetical protein
MPPDYTIRKFTTGYALIAGQTERVEAPPIFAILIGETIYNLRAALDYLVYEIAHLDTGKPKNGTKFLIEDTIKGWNEHLPHPGMPRKRQRKLWLHKLTLAHQAALKRLQPCCGCKWTGQLRDLSNPDKHHRLLAVSASKSDRRGSAIAFYSVVVNLKLTTHVEFQNGSPVVKTLKLFQKQVADVIEAFDPDFQ